MTHKPPSADLVAGSIVAATGVRLRIVEPGNRWDPRLAGSRRVDLVAVNAAMHQLVASPDPAVVFGHLAQLLVPAVCDEVTSMVQPGVVDQTAARSAVTSARRCRRGGDADADPARFTVVVDFNSESAPLARATDTPTPAGYQVALTCTWWVREPTAPEVALIELLGRYAAGAVNQARQAAALRDADQQIANLRVGLTSNRRIGAAIGVLMTRHKLTYRQSFELLAATSQHANRKLVALAEDVVLTGELPQ